MRTGAGLMVLQCARSSRASFEAGDALYEIQAKDVWFAHIQRPCVLLKYMNTL